MRKNCWLLADCIAVSVLIIWSIKAATGVTALVKSVLASSIMRAATSTNVAWNRKILALAASVMIFPAQNSFSSVIAQSGYIIYQ